MEKRESKMFDASRWKSSSYTVYSHPNEVKDFRMTEDKVEGQVAPAVLCLEISGHKNLPDKLVMLF